MKLCLSFLNHKKTKINLLKYLTLMPNRNEKIGLICSKTILVFSLLCSFNLLYFISQAASPIIRSDSWYYLDTIVLKWATKGFDFFDIFIKRQLIDHSQPLNKISLYLNYKFFNLDFRVEALIGYFGLILLIILSVNIYFKRFDLENRTWLSGVFFIGAISMITSLNTTEIYTWSLVTFAFIYLLLAFIVAIMAFNFLNEKSTFLSLSITMAIFLLLGDTAAVIVWLSITICVVFLAFFNNRTYRTSSLKWIIITGLLLFIYFIAVNAKFITLEWGRELKPQHENNIYLLNPFSYIEILRIVFSSAIAHALHLQVFGKLSRILSFVIACVILVFYIRYFILLISYKDKITKEKFITLFLLVYATVSIIAIIFGRIPDFGIEYLKQPRYVFFYQIIPFALLLDAAFTAKLKFKPLRIFKKIYFVTLTTSFILLQTMFILSAYRSIYWLSKYNDKQVKTIGYYTKNKELPQAECTEYSAPLCQMPPDKRNMLLGFLEHEELNVFNPSFQWRYRFFPFNSYSNLISILNWGPQQIITTESINTKKEIWLKVSQFNAASDYVVDIGGYKVTPFVSKNIITFTIPDEIALIEWSIQY